MTTKTNIKILSIISIFLILMVVTCVSAVTETNQTLSNNVASSTTTSNLGVFYYPWAGGSSDGYRHWQDHGHNPPKTWFGNYLPDYGYGFNPSIDLYSSKDPNIIKQDLGLMKRAGIGFVISSWWGQNSYEDQALDIIFNQILPAADNPHPDVKFAIYYEKEGFADVPISEILSDINYIKSKYTNSSYYYKINGKPVIFVYNSYTANLSVAQKWKQVRDATGIYTVLKVFSGYKNNSGLADSFHQYAPTTPYEIQGNYSAFVSPGYYKGDETVRLERENFTRFENNVISLKNANVQFKLIETWNEWGEGTGIAPAQLINHNDTGIFTPAAPSYGTGYIDILGKYFSSSPASSITETLPNGGENWTRGTTRTISWTYTGNPGPNVKIELLKGGILDSMIIQSTPNNGTYSWTIPSTQILGNDYSIRISSTTDSTIVDVSNNNFNIIAIPDRLNPGDILGFGQYIISQNGQSKFTLQGDGNLVFLFGSQTIWSSGTIGQGTLATMRTDGNFVIYGVNNVAVWSTNTQAYPGALLTVQNDGKVVVYDQNNVARWSVPIVTQPFVTVISPNGGEKWKHGTTHTISWSKTGNPGTNVKIELLKGGVLSRGITASKSGTSYKWTIPAKQLPGADYVIRITSTNNSTYKDTSNNNFTII